MDVLEPHIGDEIKPHGYRRDEQDREDDEADEDSFFRFGHGLKAKPDFEMLNPKQSQKN
jgi:hypothetical protein